MWILCQDTPPPRPRIRDGTPAEGRAMASCPSLTRMRLLYAVWAAALCSYAGAFIVPDQLVSLLTVVYSVIPPIKKGTDSRVGFGYRFGPFADVQVLLELGPQAETQPIGSQAAAGGKRQAATASDADPGKLPDIQVLDEPVVASSRSARSRPAPAVSAAPARLGPAVAADWLSRWRSSVGVTPPPAPPAPPPEAADLRFTGDGRPRPVRASTSGFGRQAAPQRRASEPLAGRWEAMQRLRSLYRLAPY